MREVTGQWFVRKAKRNFNMYDLRAKVEIFTCGEDAEPRGMEQQILELTISPAAKCFAVESIKPMEESEYASCKKELEQQHEGKVLFIAQGPTEVPMFVLAVLCGENGKCVVVAHRFCD